MHCQTACRRGGAVVEQKFTYQFFNFMNPTERADGTPCTPMPKPSISITMARTCVRRTSAGRECTQAAACGGRFRTKSELRASAGARLRPAQSCGLQYSHAPASPAAEAISDKGRPQRRSVKNRKSFDCFKSAVGIRFSAGARQTPKSFHRGGFSVTFCPNKR